MAAKIVRMCKILTKFSGSVHDYYHQKSHVQLATTPSKAVLLLVGCLVVFTPTVQAKTYVEFAEALVGNLPADAQVREDLEAQLAAEANQYRRAKGVAILKASPAMQKAARAQAIDMMLNGFVGHKASSGHSFETRMRAFMDNPMMMPKMAENAARETQKGEANAAKARRLFQQWVDSRPHRKALLNGTYKFVSTGVVQRGNKIWAIQIFFAPLPGDGKPAGSGGLY